MSSTKFPQILVRRESPTYRRNRFTTSRSTRWMRTISFQLGLWATPL